MEDVRRAYPEGVPASMSAFVEDPEPALADLITDAPFRCRMSS